MALESITRREAMKRLNIALAASAVVSTVDFGSKFYAGQMGFSSPAETQAPLSVSRVNLFAQDIALAAKRQIPLPLFDATVPPLYFLGHWGGGELLLNHSEKAKKYIGAASWASAFSIKLGFQSATEDPRENKKFQEYGLTNLFNSVQNKGMGYLNLFFRGALGYIFPSIGRGVLPTIYSFYEKDSIYRGQMSLALSLGMEVERRINDGNSKRSILTFLSGISRNSPYIPK